MVKRRETMFRTSIESATDDVPVSDVTAWCKHIRAHQVSTSLYGQEVGLPIGPKAIECPQIDGTVVAQTYRQAAEAFVESHCLNCAHHEPQSEISFGQEVATRVAEREAAAKTAAEDRQEIRKLEVPGIDVEAVLSGNVDSDEKVRTLVSRLADDTHKTPAALALEQASQDFPELFSREVTEVMSGAFRDREIGGAVMRAVRRLAGNLPGVWPRVAAEAKAALANYANVEEAAITLDCAMRGGHLAPDADVARALMLALDPLVPPLHPFGGTGRAPREAVGRALETLAKLDSRMLEGVVLRALSSESAWERAQAAAAVAARLGVDGCRSAARLVTPLLEALAIEDDEGDADPSLLRALGKCIAADPARIGDCILDSLPLDDEELSTLYLRGFWQPEVEQHTERPWLTRLWEMLGDRSVPVDIQTDIVSLLESLRRGEGRGPEMGVEMAIAALGRLCLQLDAAQEDRPSPDEIATSDALERDLAHRKADTLVSRFRSRVVAPTVAQCGLGADGLAAFVTDPGSGASPSFRRQLIRLAGNIGNQSEKLASEMCGLLSSHLVTPDDPHLRGAAAAACFDMVNWNRGALPDDVVVLVVGLLDDEWLHPVVSNAARVLERCELREPEVARRAFLGLAGIYQLAFRDAGQSDLIKSITRALLNISRQYPSLTGPTVGVLTHAARTLDYYTSNYAIDDLAPLIRTRQEFQQEFVETILVFYERFNLGIGSMPELTTNRERNDAFNDLHRLHPDEIAARSTRLVEFAAKCNSDINSVPVATLLIPAGRYEAAAAAFRTHVEALPEEPRFDGQRSRSRALALALEAELLISRGCLMEAKRRYQEALECANERSERRATVRRVWGIDVEIARRPSLHVDWASLRLGWLDLPDEPGELEISAEGLARDAAAVLAHALPRREQLLGQITNEVLNAARFVGRWARGVREGASGSDSALVAAVSRLADALRVAKQLEETGCSRDLMADLSEIIERVETLGPRSDLDDAIKAFRKVRIPFPRLGLPVPEEPTRRARARAPDRDDTDGESPEGAPGFVAIASIRINGEDASSLVPLQAGRLYDAEVTVTFASPPGQSGRLVMRALTSLPDHEYSFPAGEIVLEADRTSYAYPGPLKINAPQSKESAPILFRLEARVDTNGDADLPVELFGRYQFEVLSFASSEDLLGPSATVDEATKKIIARLGEILPEYGGLDRTREAEVASELVKYASYQLQQGEFRGKLKIQEHEFNHSVRSFLLARARDHRDWGEVHGEVRSGIGFVDILVRNVPVELKVCRQGELDGFIVSSLPQATQYVVTQGRQVGFLAVLDTRPSADPTPPIADDVDVRVGPTAPGIDPDSGNRIAIGVVVVRAQTTVPSRLKGRQR